ncbi:outer membrane beta-barrel protein [Halobacteriovorax sp. GB3]|uniref:outer membrane beta-barrel protein n=1 Tax=Halobacteriovorax sp. GB3 TaxID=2719615 RepID=UPI0023607EB6|nr:outer membrane beta-barrel protein [Halobacteriovorax sp. GB3]MDD0853320.1 outer membrane beta-barrel protein [Halobacteriovorax sp. GB3]
MKKLLLVLCATLMVNAQAGVLVEPYLGYRLVSGEDSNSSKTEYDYNGSVIGGRLGYQFLGFMGGLDYSRGLGAYELEQKDSSGTSKNDYTQSSFGLFAGYELPILLRAWVTYWMSNKLEGDSGAVNGDEFNGSGYGLGIGFTGLPFVSLNLEYRNMTYDEFFDKAAGTTTALSGDSEIGMSEILLSVSLPLDF